MLTREDLIKENLKLKNALKESQDSNWNLGYKVHELEQENERITKLLDDAIECMEKVTEYLESKK